MINFFKLRLGDMLNFLPKIRLGMLINVKPVSLRLNIKQENCKYQLPTK